MSWCSPRVMRVASAVGKVARRPCGGRGLCVHGARQDACRACGGSRFCVHGTRKQRCRACGTLSAQLGVLEVAHVPFGF